MAVCVGLGVGEDRARFEKAVRGRVRLVGGRNQRRELFLGFAHQAQGGVDAAHAARALGNFKGAVARGFVGAIKRPDQPRGRNAQKLGHVRGALQIGAKGAGLIILRARGLVFGKHPIPRTFQTWPRSRGHVK